MSHNTWALIWDSFRKVYGPVLTLIGILISLIPWYFSPQAEIYLGIIVPLAMIVLIFILTLFQALHKALEIDIRQSLSILSVQKELSDKTLLRCIVPPSPQFATNMLVSFYFVDNRIHTPIGMGRVFDTARNGDIEVTLDYLVEGNDNILDDIVSQKKDVLEKVEVRPYISSTFAQIISEQVQKSHMYDLGVANIYPSFPYSEFIKCVSSAKSIKIMQTWTPNVAYQIQEALASAVNNNDAEVEVVLLQEGDIATQRIKEQDARNPDILSVDNIHTTIKNLQVARSKCSDKAHNFKLRLTPLLPSISAYICDNRAFIGFFLKNKKSVDSVFLEVVGEGNLLRQAIDEEFRVVFRHERNTEPPENLWPRL